MIYVFIGPTISVEEAKIYLDAVYLPPAAQGDVAGILRRDPEFIGIIDGYFDREPSVWHKEILLALHSGVPVVGGASLGALRAAELWPFGMVGIGEIFEWYRDGKIEADDEVAVAHGPEELDYISLSESLVNFRETLVAAQREGVVSQNTHDRIIELARSMYYPLRTYPRIFDDGQRCGLSERELQALEIFVSDHRIDLKKQDAVRVLKYLNSRPAIKIPLFDFQYTNALDNLLNCDILLARVDRTRITPRGVIEAGKKTDKKFAALEQRAAASRLYLAEAKYFGITVSPTEFQASLDGFLAALGLRDQKALEDWKNDNHLTDREFSAFVEEFTLIAKAGRLAPTNLDVLRQLRIEGKYKSLAAVVGGLP